MASRVASCAQISALAERFIMKGVTSSASGKPELFYSSAGHMLMHLMTAFFAFMVVQLEDEWAMPHQDLIVLLTLATVLTAVAALPAGWLADRWSSPGMIVVFFFGIGLSSIFCAFTPDRDIVWMTAGLGGIGF